MPCKGCPCGFDDYSEYIQGLGCLPCPYDLIQMKEQSGHNWACHEDESKMCAGYAVFMKEVRPDLDIKTGGLISYNTWYHEGQEAAMEEAERKHNEQVSE